MSALNPVHTVGAQLAEAYRAHHDVSRRDARARAVEALELVGIPQPARRADQFPHEFSGGMRQRVDHRDGRHQRPAPAHRGRAHDRARRHRAGPDPGDPPGGPGADRRGDHDDHPRPGGGRGHRRPGAGDVRRNGRWSPARWTRCSPRPRMPYTARPARFGAASRAGRPAAARPSPARRRRCCACPARARSPRGARWSPRSAGRPSRSCSTRTARAIPCAATAGRCVAGVARPQELFARREIGHPDTEVELGGRGREGAEDDQSTGAAARSATWSSTSRCAGRGIVPPHRGSGAGGVGRVAGPRRGRDARAGRRVRLRQVDRRRGRSCSCIGRRRAPCSSTGRELTTLSAAAAPRRAPRPADRLPGPVRVAQPADGRSTTSSPSRCSIHGMRRAAVAARVAVDELLETVGLNPEHAQPLPARVLRRAAAAHRHRPGARARPALSCSTSRSRRSTSRCRPVC